MRVGNSYLTEGGFRLLPLQIPPVLEMELLHQGRDVVDLLHQVLTNLTVIISSIVRLDL